MSNFNCHNNTVVEEYWQVYSNLDKRIADKAWCDYDFPDYYTGDIHKKLQYFMSLMYTHDKTEREHRLMDFMKNYFRHDIQFLLALSNDFCNRIVTIEEFQSQELFDWMIHKNPDNFKIFKLNIETLLQQLTLITTPYDEVKNIIIRSICYYLANYFIKL